MRTHGGGRGWLAVDLGLGGLLGVGGFVDGFATSDFPHPSSTVALLMGIAGVAQSLRRLRPLLAFTISTAAMAAVAVLFGHFESGASLLIAMAATYSVVVYGSNLLFVVAVLIGFSAALDVDQPFEEAVWDLAFTLVFSGLAVAAGVGVRSMRSRAALSAERAAALEAERDAAAGEAAERERRLLARELHDILAHGLGVIVLQAGAAEHVLEVDPERARAAIGSVRVTAQEAIGELQTLVRAVRADAVNHREPPPTLADLQRLADQATSSEFSVTFSVDGEPRAVPAAIQTSVYRVAQEGVTNAIKHSGAGTCTVSLGYREDDVRIEVVDDGISGRRADGSRAGLVGVRERVTFFGGSVRFGPREGGGWSLVADFPTAR
jgi:signal transduction histidine kinase